MTDDPDDQLEAWYAAAAAEPYLPEHRPSAQTLVDGVPVNPTLRSRFDSTDNDDRDPLELEDWWNLPYVVTEGNRAEVRCLDGGAWDRSTWRGTFDTVDEAVAHARRLVEQGGPVIGKRLGLAE